MSEAKMWLFGSLQTIFGLCNFFPFFTISLIKYIYICLILGLVSFVASDFLDAATGDELAMWGKLDVDQYLPNRSKLHYTVRRCHF